MKSMYPSPTPSTGFPRAGLPLTSQVQLHATVVNHGGVDLAVDDLETGHSEHGWLLLPLVLIGPFP